MTWMNMCEVVSHGFKDFLGKDVTPQQVWNSSPTGELAHIVWYYDAFVECYRKFGDVSPTQ